MLVQEHLNDAAADCKYVLKGLEKPSSNSPTQSIFLPQNVAYMVKLKAYFQSEQKIFLLLQHAQGGCLYDYLQSYACKQQHKTKSMESLFPKDLEERDLFVKSKQLLEPPANNADFEDIVRCSQQLLKSVSKTLDNVKHLAEPSPPPKSPLKSPQKFAIAPFKAFQLPELSFKRWASQLAIAIQCLHDKGIILRDLHMHNILLGNKGQLLLSYFYQHEGLSDTNSMLKAYSLEALSGHFVAAERPLTFKSDWWSYGVVLYQLLINQVVHCIYLCFQFKLYVR